MGTPIAAPIRNGASRASFIDLRNFRTAQPCTIRPKAATKTVHWAGGRKCSQTGHRHDRKRKTRQARAKRRGKGAPHLVADFRVDRRPRRFPRRDRLSSDILAEHGAAIAPSALRRDLWQALTTPPRMMLAAFQVRAAVRLSTPTDDAGTIVTAGAGSGKTIAFYLPGMIRIGEAIGVDHG
jgi:hypothetical protein